MHMSFARSTALQSRLHEIVPGGAHTFAKGSDQYPEDMAPVLVRGHGARVWDVDGNEFVEYGMGMRAVTLGHGYAPVLDAVRAAVGDGVSFTRPTTLELAAAEDFLTLVPGADMVKFCKNASDATAAAVRLARAATGREIVAVCRDQPFFSSQDWFVGTLPIDTGVPTAVRARVRTHSTIGCAACWSRSETSKVGRSPRTFAASRRITSRSAPTSGARSILLITSKSERVTPGPPARPRTWRGAHLRAIL